MLRKPSEWIALMEKDPVAFAQQVLPVVLSSIAVPAAITALALGSSVVGPTTLISTVGM